MAKEVTFYKRTGPPLDFIDSRDYAAIAEARKVVDSLALELEDRPVGDAAATPELDAFLDKLGRVTARVRLNAALAFKESAGLNATWTAERLASGGVPVPKKDPVDDSTVLFDVAPLDVSRGKDDTFDKRFTKLLLYFMSSSRARSESAITSFLAPVASPSEILRHIQWFHSTLQVVAKMFDRLPATPAERDAMILRQTPEELEKTLKEALRTSGAPYAEGQTVEVAPRTTVIETIVADERRGIILEDTATRAMTTYPGLHASPLIALLRTYREPRLILEQLSAMLVRHSYDAANRDDRYTTIANRIALELTALWHPYPVDKKNPTQASVKALSAASRADPNNSPLSAFLESINESRDELEALAKTTYFKERGYAIGARGKPSTGEILGALYRALNNPPSPSQKNASDTKKSTDATATSTRRPGRPRKNPDTLKMQPMPLGVSYISESRLDPTGANDIATANGLLDETLVKAFRDEVRAARGQKKKGKHAHATDDDKNEDEDSFSDKIKTNMARASRLQTMIERCEAMLYPSGEENSAASTAAAVPEFPREKGFDHTHPDDAGYFRLHLQEHALAKDGSASLVARRRWWWAYMFVALVRVDMAGRRGPHVFKNRTYLEVSEFLRDPVAFATDERRHWTVTGPPGTGKTSFLRLMGVLYHLLGLYPLSSINDRQVVVLQMRDLIAGYEGQSALRATEVFTDSIGTFAPIDEAYALVPVKRGEAISPYSQQVIDTLLTVLNDARSLMGTALVGYSSGVLDRLLHTNDGLQRRFPRSFAIPEYSAKDIVSVLLEVLRLKKRGDLADALVKQRGLLVSFFEFITGTTGTFVHNGVTYKRDVFVQQRYDESDEDHAKREEAVKKSRQFGNLFAHENASGALDVVAIVLRDKALTGDTVTPVHVIDATRQLLLQRSLIEVSDAERAQREKGRKDVSTDDD